MLHEYDISCKNAWKKTPYLELLVINYRIILLIKMVIIVENLVEVSSVPLITLCWLLFGLNVNSPASFVYRTPRVLISVQFLYTQNIRVRATRKQQSDDVIMLMADGKEQRRSLVLALVNQVRLTVKERLDPGLIAVGNQCVKRIKPRLESSHGDH